jgi:hypothetical protein
MSLFRFIEAKKKKNFHFSHPHRKRLSPGDFSSDTAGLKC